MGNLGSCYFCGIGLHASRCLPSRTLTESQAGILAIWVGMGGKRSPCRLVGTLLPLMASAWLTRECSILRDDYRLLELAFSLEVFVHQTILSTMLFLLARLGGIAVSGDSEADSARIPGKWQYSLRSLLAWTTALAVLLGALVSFWHYLSGRFPRLGEYGMVLLAYNTPITLAAAWTALGRGWPAVRIIALALIVTGITLSPWPFRFELWTGYQYFGAPALWTIASLWLVRLAGYRLVWRGTARI
jgi:hypothetical protein